MCVFFFLKKWPVQIHVFVFTNWINAMSLNVCASNCEHIFCAKPRLKKTDDPFRTRDCPNMGFQMWIRAISLGLDGIKLLTCVEQPVFANEMILFLHIGLSPICFYKHG